MGKIILASGSPRRKKLLEQLNFQFEIIVSNIDESVKSTNTPEEIVQNLATRKAEDVSARLSDALVIGADTIVSLDGTILEKPNDETEAVEMLQMLSGRKHQVFTGVALQKKDAAQNIAAQHTFYERTDVTFGTIDEKDIRSYVKSGSPMDKAGGYGIQDDFGAIFVKCLNGDYYNVVGFPLYSFYQTMKSFAPEYLEQSNRSEHNE